MQTKEEIIAKIQKLMNLQEGAEAVGNTHEAEAAALRVQEFLLKYNLNMQDVQNQKVQEKVSMIMDTLDLNNLQAKTEAEWLYKLFGSIARHYLCKAIRTRARYIKNDQGRMQILGEPNNVAIVMYTVEQLVAKIRIAEKWALKAYDGFEKRNTYKRGFLVGAVAGIDSKLAEQQRMMTQNNQSMGLMVINKMKEVDAFAMIKFPNVKTSKSASLMSRDGMNKGYEVGYKMTINQGVGQSKPKGHIS